MYKPTTWFIHKWNIGQKWVKVISLNPTCSNNREHFSKFRAKIIAPKTRKVKTTQKKGMCGEK